VPLEVYVCGPGFGETVVLMWQEGGTRCAALVDCFAGPRGQFLISWLQELGVDHLSFVVASHPHVDHIFNMYHVLARYQGEIGRFWWWGGMGEIDTITYFRKLAGKFPENSNHLSARAKAIEQLLIERARQLTQYGKPPQEIMGEVMAVYPLPAMAGSALRALSLSPWADQRLNYMRIVAEGIKPHGVIEDTHREMNLISSALLVTYGSAQVVLGGDVEQSNWKDLRNSGRCPALSPCVVKVSHHGSSTGRIDEMWSEGGFFGRQDRAPVAVLTPWRGTLPEKSVIDEIRGAGCKVCVTGQPIGSGRTRPLKSFVHLQVQENGLADVVEHSANVAIYDP
jgi:hypothetical protein